jgi:hypothetical protein
MSAYEIPDESLDFIIQLLHDRASGHSAEVAALLESQRPIPVPVKIGAVVRAEMPTRGLMTLIRCDFDSENPTPWIGRLGQSWHRTDKIGRIVEVLSPGVDIGE